MHAWCWLMWFSVCEGMTALMIVFCMFVFHYCGLPPLSTEYRTISTFVAILAIDLSLHTSLEEIYQ